MINKKILLVVLLFLTISISGYILWAKQNEVTVDQWGRGKPIINLKPCGPTKTQTKTGEPVIRIENCDMSCNTDADCKIDCNGCKAININETCNDNGDFYDCFFGPYDKAKCQNKNCFIERYKP